MLREISRIKRTDVKWKSNFQERIKYVGNATYVDKYNRLTISLNFLKTHMTAYGDIMGLIKST